jgi:hypothetical protein
VAFLAVVAFFLPGNAGSGTGVAQVASDGATLSVPDGDGKRSVHRSLDVSSVLPYEAGRIRRLPVRRCLRAPSVEASDDDTGQPGSAHLILARSADERSRESHDVTAAFAVARAGRRSAPSTAPPGSPF